MIAGGQTQHHNSVLKAGVWQHVAVVFGRGTARLYLDGQAVE